MARPVIRGILFCIVLFVTSFVSATIEQQIDKLIPVFAEGGIQQIKKATNDLAYAGISSPRLYDAVEKRLMAGYQQSGKPEIEMTGWLIRALSYSGNNQYQGSLQQIANSKANRKVQGYAKRGLETLARYSQWNPEISKDLAGLNDNQAQIQRVKNMLGSSNDELVRMGAKRIYNTHSSNKELLALAEKRLLDNYQSANDDRIFIDTMAWLCKALAASGDSAYLPTMQKIEAGAKNRKLQKYAKKYAATL